MKVKASCVLLSDGGLKATTQPTEMLIEALTSMLMLLAREKGDFMVFFNSPVSTDQLIAQSQLVAVRLCQDISVNSCSREQSAGKSIVLSSVIDLVSALMNFSWTLAMALGELSKYAATVTTSPQQNAGQGRLHPALISRLITAGKLLNQLLQLWLAVSLHLCGYPAGHRPLVNAAAAVAYLVASVVPEFLRASLSSLSNDPALQSMKKVASDAAQIVPVLCYTITVTMWQVRASQGEEPRHQQLDFNLLFLGDGMVELVLLSLSEQAHQLQASAVDTPSWAQSSNNYHQAKTPSASSSAASEDSQQQQQQQHEQQPSWRAQHQAILSSRTRLCTAWGTIVGLLGFRSLQMTVQEWMIPKLTCTLTQYARVKLASSTRRANGIGRVPLFGLFALDLAVAHCLPAIDRCSISVHLNGQRQLLTHAAAVPNTLIIPTVKVLIEMMLLLSTRNMDEHIVILNLIMLLLHSLAASQTKGVKQALLTATAVAGAAATRDEQSIWPSLPATAAAGLLHPVVQLLPKVVLKCLATVQTVLLQQQQQEEANSSHQQGSPGADRRLLLHAYGRLLITICLAVKSKHIAAAMKSDPISSLTAIEAVIRAQACHWLPATYQSQPQLQFNTRVASASGVRAKAAATATAAGSTISNSSSGHTCPSISDTLKGYPQGQLPATLLAFSWKAMHAAHELLRNRQHLVSVSEFPRSEMVRGLAAIAAICRKVFSLAVTTCKMGMIASDQCLGQQASVIPPPTSASDKVHDEALRTCLLREYLAGLSAVNAVAATLNQYNQILERYSVLVSQCRKATSCSSSAHVDGSSCGSASNRLDTKATRGLDVVILLKMLNE